ncbi:MAG: SDR family oxidoreductase [Deltaproteobacteria bacterium]
MKRFEGKVGIVTGASSGIGEAAARQLAREGARLVLGARRAAVLDEVVAAIAAEGGEATALAGDVQDEAYAQALVSTAVEKYGGLDVAFDNAGTLGAMGPLVEIDAAGWEETLRVNLTSAFFAAKHQVPAMVARGRGSIVFTSTFVGHTVGMPNMGPYAASKAGLIGLTKSLAAELGASGVRVNALLPGGTDTPMGRTVASTPEARQYVAGLHALKRLAAPEEIAWSALHLLSDEASFVTGVALLADGGVSIARG